MGDGLSRRDLLRRAGAGALGVAGLAGLEAVLPAAPAAAAEAQRSRVVALRHSGIVDEGRKLRPAVAARLVGEAVQRLVGAEKPDAAWAKLFKPDDVVGIKVNCLGGPQLSTSPTLVAAVAACLQRAGVKPENIIVWDRNDGELARVGFTVNRGDGIKVYGTEGDYGPVVQQGAFAGPLSKILTERITCLVNMPILKDHTIAGVTFSLKNHYGSHRNPSSHHGNFCDPFIADLNSLPDIAKKTRLVLGDLTRACWDGGPDYRPNCTWEPGAVLAATDPVAADAVAWRMIDAKRTELGQPTLEKAGRLPKSILTAAERGLGAADAARIELVEKQIA